MKRFSLVTGGTGLIGQPIVDALVRQNQPVKVLTRNPHPSANPLLEFVRWNPSTMEIAPDAVTNVSGILHLAGAPVAQRWTATAKKAILNSRTQSTALLAQAIAALPEDERPAVCVGASAIGLYPSGQDWNDEESPADEAFWPTLFAHGSPVWLSSGTRIAHGVPAHWFGAIAPRRDAGQAAARLSTGLGQPQAAANSGNPGCTKSMCNVRLHGPSTNRRLQARTMWWHLSL